MAFTHDDNSLSGTEAYINYRGNATHPPTPNFLLKNIYTHILILAILFNKITFCPL